MGKRYITTHEQIEGYAQQLGISVAELARRAGVSVPTLHKLLRHPERVPNVNTLAALAAYIAGEIGASPRTVFVNMALGAGRVYDILHPETGQEVVTEAVVAEAGGGPGGRRYRGAASA